MVVLNRTHQLAQFLERFLAAVAVVTEFRKRAPVQIAKEPEMLELKNIYQPDGYWNRRQEFSPCLLRDENSFILRWFRDNSGVNQSGMSGDERWKRRLRNTRKTQARRKLFKRQWFAVSSDPQRYAPFEAVKGDTQRSIRSRIVKYYEHRLWVRAQPVVPHEKFVRPGKPAMVAAPAKP